MCILIQPMSFIINSNSSREWDTVPAILAQCYVDVFDNTGVLNNGRTGNVNKDDGSVV